MTFVDELQLHLKAGDGGDGVVRWLHLKNKEFSGPAGGDGGRGGDIIARTVRDPAALEKYRDKKFYRAGNGKDGRSKSQHGERGKDFVLEVPLGTVITNQKTGESVELLKEEQTECLLAGGGGGLGNEHFKGSRNIRSRQSTQGKPGEEENFFIELQLIADAGFIGFPNAGKTSLLNALTHAHAKVGAYAFTTLDPNLGDLYGFILADIPGLIEGAAEGKGLGDKFLRHIKRTRILFHVISLEEPDVLSAYRTVRRELEAYSPSLSAKREIVLLNKRDIVSEHIASSAQGMLESADDTACERVFIVSAIDTVSVKMLQDELVKILQTL